jgi:hypothetical protein
MHFGPSFRSYTGWLCSKEVQDPSLRQARQARHPDVLCST